MIKLFLYEPISHKVKRMSSAVLNCVWPKHAVWRKYKGGNYLPVNYCLTWEQIIAIFGEIIKNDTDYINIKNVIEKTPTQLSIHLLHRAYRFR